MGKKARRAQTAATTASPAARPPVEAPGDPNAWTVKDRRYWPVVGAIVALGAALRLYQLDTPPFQHDEAIYSIFSLNFHDYNFDPIYHGPSLYHILHVFFRLFGGSDYTARMVSVLMGFATFALVIGPVRRWLGDRGALAALALHTISPVMVTYQRRILFDAFVVVLTLGSVILFQKTRVEPLGSGRWIRTWVGLVAVLVVFLATKANAFFVIAMLGSFWVAQRLRGVGGRELTQLVPLPKQLPLLMFAVVSIAAIVLGPRYPEDMPRTRRHEQYLVMFCVASSAFLWEWLRRTGSEWRSARKAAPAIPDGAPSVPVAGKPVARIALCVGLCLLVGGLIYAFLFGHGYLLFVRPKDWTLSRYGPDVLRAMRRMLEYWGGQQKAPRLPGRHDFYLPLMIAYELPILLAFIGGVVKASRQRAPFTDLVLWWSFTSWTLYAMANEKVPWLMTHLVAPFALLGGWWLGQLRPRGLFRPGAAVLAALGAAFLLRNVSAANYERAVDNREPMFYSFTGESLKDTLFHAVEVARSKTGDVWIYNAWPPSWYMRQSAFGGQLTGAAISYPEHEPPATPLRLVMCMEPDWEKYKAERFQGWHKWTYEPGKGVVADAGGPNPHILNWPRLSWYSFRPDLFVPWFVHRTAEIPVFPPPANHSFVTNTAFLTEWSHIPVVVGTPP